MPSGSPLVAYDNSRKGRERSRLPGSGRKRLMNKPLVPLHILISPTHRPDCFSVALGSKILVKSSRQPRCDAARVLHELGFPDDALLVSHKEGSKSDYSMRGLLGEWRQS